MRIIVVGCGRVGSTLAHQFYTMGHQVVVIDQDAGTFDNLPIDFRGRTIEGDVLVRNVLHQAEVETADALVAVTRSDSLNALIAHVVRTEYQVSKVLARNTDPRQRPLQEAFGILVIGSMSWNARRIEALLSDVPLRAVFVDRTSNLTVYELAVPETWQARTLQELLPDKGITILAYSRAGRPRPVSPTLALEAGDLIHLSGEAADLEALRRRLPLGQEQLA